MPLHQDSFTCRLNLEDGKKKDTFQVIISACSGGVFTDGAPVSSGPLVIQITQILQLSGAGCCKKKKKEWVGNGLRYSENVQRCTTQVSNSLLESISVSMEMHGKRLLMSMINAQQPWGGKREDEKKNNPKTPISPYNLKIIQVWRDQIELAVSRWISNDHLLTFFNIVNKIQTNCTKKEEKIEKKTYSIRSATETTEITERLCFLSGVFKVFIKPFRQIYNKKIDRLPGS